MKLSCLIFPLSSRIVCTYSDKIKTISIWELIMFNFTTRFNLNIFFKLIAEDSFNTFKC